MVKTSSSPEVGASNIDHSSRPCLPVPKQRGLNECVRESQLQLWIWHVISEISFGFDYEQYLRDGVILCQLIKALAPDASGQSSVVGACKDKRQKAVNIRRFLDSCRAYGLTADELFEVEDLLSFQDIPRVTRCLFALGKHAASKFGQPVLGQPYDEWLEAQLCAASGTECNPPGSSPFRRSGMPIGDDLYVSHVNTTWLKDRLEKRRAAAASAIQRPPPEPILQRIPSKPLSELRAMFTDEPRDVSPIK